MSCEWVMPLVDQIVNVTRFAVVAWAIVRVIEILVIRIRVRA